MRTYGRVTDEFGVKTWIVVTTDANGYDDAVFLTTLVQNLKLNLNESPFFGDWGIPAKPSVVTQVYPDFNVSLTQQRFAPYFANLIISRETEAVDVQGYPYPRYRVNVVTNSGSIFSETVATEVPT